MCIATHAMWYKCTVTAMRQLRIFAITVLSDY